MLIAQALLAVAPATIPCPNADLGPPAICHPIAIDGAHSLPWGDHAFATDAKYDLEKRLVHDTISILRESDSTFVHMETLRRAAIYIGGHGDGKSRLGKSARAKLANELGAALRDAAVDAALAEGKNPAVLRRREALAWFDFGYFYAARGQTSSSVDERAFPALEKASKMAAEDGAMHLGVALGLWQRGGDRSSLYGHLDQAARRCAKAREGLLGRNVLATAAQFMGCDSHEEFRRALDKKLGRA